MIDIAGRWALVTGASRGLGREAARVLAERGANLVLASRAVEGTAELEREVKALGVKAYSVAAELSEHASVTAMLDEIAERGTDIDIVLNNAGLQVPYRDIVWDTTAEDFEISYKVNLLAPATICYRLLPPMMERGFGRIVNTTSGIQLDPHQAGYSASKAALDKFTVDLATLVDGSDVILSLVDPGWCRTDLGGPNAMNSVESALPGIVLGVFVDDRRSGRYIRAQEYAGMSLEDAISKISV